MRASCVTTQSCQDDHHAADCRLQSIVPLSDLLGAGLWWHNILQYPILYQICLWCLENMSFVHFYDLSLTWLVHLNLGHGKSVQSCISFK